MGRRSGVPHTREQLQALSTEELAKHIVRLRLRLRFASRAKKRELAAELAAAQALAGQSDKEFE